MGHSCSVSSMHPNYTHTYIHTQMHTICIKVRRGLEERLAAGENILCAEGYVLALTRMGYVAPGVWIPEFLIERPEVLRNLHYQFTDAGSDVTEAYQVCLVDYIMFYLTLLLCLSIKCYMCITSLGNFIHRASESLVLSCKMLYVYKRYNTMYSE